MKKVLLALMILLSSTSIAEARYCNNPYCAMCNRIFGYMAGYGPKRTVRARPAVKQEEPEAIEELDFDPTHKAAITEVLKLAELTKDDTFYDLGCGDARVMLAAMEDCNCKAVGIEIDEDTAKMAEDATARYRRALIVRGDATKFHLDTADVVYMYLFPDVIAKVHESLTSARMVISLNHDIPQLQTKTLEFDNDGEPFALYYWSEDFPQAPMPVMEAPIPKPKPELKLPFPL